MTARHTIVGLGEVLWDVFPDGAKFGGAPANFACHAAAMGAAAAMVSCVGSDELGEKAIKALAGHGVDTRSVGRSAEHPTGTVRVTVDAAGKPDYEITRDVAWDHIAWSEAVDSLTGRADAVCFGSLAQRSEGSRQTIYRFLEATSPNCLRVFDVNLRQDFYNEQIIRRSLNLANVLKLNDEELPIVANLCGIEEQDLDAVRRLAEQFELRLVALTRGSEGAMLVSGSEVCHKPAGKVEIADTVGAGDSFTAAMVRGSLQGKPLEEIARWAIDVAAYVCWQPGATPSLPQRLRG